MSNRVLVPLIACGACIASLGFILVSGGGITPASGAAPVLDAAVPAPAFELRRVGGGNLSSDALRGKLTVLDIWASWCGPCLVEMPDYDAIEREYGDRDVEVIGVAVSSGSEAQVQEVLRDHFRVSYAIGLGDTAFERGYGPIWALPRTLLIDRDWRIRKVWTGALPAKHAQIRVLLDRLLQEPADH